jgi:hypothetical protein
MMCLGSAVGATLSRGGGSTRPFVEGPFWSTEFLERIFF